MLQNIHCPPKMYAKCALKFDFLLSLQGCTYLITGALTTFPYKLRLIFFCAWGMNVHPVHNPGDAYDLKACAPPAVWTQIIHYTRELNSYASV